MERIESRINTSSPEYRQNFALMEASVKKLREEVERVRQAVPSNPDAATWIAASSWCATA